MRPKQSSCSTAFLLVTDERDHGFVAAIADGGMIGIKGLLPPSLLADDRDQGFVAAIAPGGWPGLKVCSRHRCWRMAWIKGL